MFDFSQITLDKLSIHFVGSPAQGEGVRTSANGLVLEDETIQQLLLRYFLTSFKGDSFYHFSHDSDLALNEMYAYAKEVFARPETFHQHSINIARHLYNSSTHPNIKSGELYVTYFESCVIGDEITDAIGIFKSESKDTYLKVQLHQTDVEVGYDEGINIQRLDKGCLILNTEADMGYKVAIVDKINRQGEAQYWKDTFLQLRPREDSFFHTQNYMKVCHEFVKEVFNESHNVDKAEQISMLNRSAKFFDTHETFNVQEFEQEVMLNEPEVIDAFKEFKQTVAEERNIPLTYEEFDISHAAVKETKKLFKSVLKLDKNFHIYIHGSRELIERGHDEEKGMDYYKLYFKEETSK
jgi:hypothetical protein